MRVAEELRKHADLAIKEGGMYYSGEYLDAIARRAESEQAENAKLRQENQSIGMAAYELGRKSMADENAALRTQLADVTESIGRVEERCAKLRELVADMWFWGYEGHMDSKSQEWQMKHIDGVLDRMREVGVETEQ